MVAASAVVEKCPRAGGNSLVSSANTAYPAHPDDVQRFCRYLTEVCDSTTSAEVVEAYVQGLVQLPGWLTGLPGGRPRGCSLAGAGQHRAAGLLCFPNRAGVQEVSASSLC